MSEKIEIAIDSNGDDKDKDDGKPEAAAIQKNLNEMIPYINQILDALPREEKVFFLTNKDYPEGVFVAQQAEGKQNPIVPQFLLTRFRSNVQRALTLAEAGQNWGWTIGNPNTDVEINNLETEFPTHLVTCYNQYISEGKDLNYKMTFLYKVIATRPNLPQVTVLSTDKFYFTVKAAS